MAGEGLTSDADRNAANRAADVARALKLRLDGAQFREIAEEMGRSVSTVHGWVTEAMAEMVAEPAAEVRRVELARLDRWQRKLEDRLDDADEDACKVIQTALRVQERRAKYLGLDEPTKFEGTVTELTQEDIALRELLAEAQARQARDEADLLGGGA